MGIFPQNTWVIWFCKIYLKCSIFFITLNYTWPCHFLSELVDAARKALISRVVELTDDRSALKLEVSTLQETVSRVEGRMREKEEETKRCRGLLQTSLHLY